MTLSTTRRVRGPSALLLGLLIAAPGIAPASGAPRSKDQLWSIPDVLPPASQKPAWVRPARAKIVELDSAAWTTVLRGIPREHTLAAMQAPGVMELPMPDGTFARFSVVESPVMEPALAARYPDLRTFVGQGLDDPGATVRMDWTPAGFHAQILSPRGAVYIDPYSKGDHSLYSCYYKRDGRRAAEGFQCLTPAGESPVTARGTAGLLRAGPTLRTYRLATAATGEYTQFHGGTVAAGLAAVVTAVNRVTGVYEIEFGVRLVLVANNDLLIYTDGNADPYTNSSGSTMLGQNQSTLDSVIGSANYDIGHVFSTGGGGIAGLGVVCVGGQKAKGVTGLGSPVGDDFYIDFVAHEMGHQFGANHTFNSVAGNCGGGNRNSSTAYEPGSGSTIMAYAGICDTDDLQPHSDPYFHSVSFDEILSFITSGSGNGCAAQGSTSNSAPTVSAGANFTIPKGTPFTLTASGSDPNGDALTYCWEERDLGAAQALTNADNGGSPLFRSFNPSTSPSRTFPKLASLVSNVPSSGERLPTLSRTMNFRVTARDNRAGGGGVNTADMQVTVDGASGPFAVTAPNPGVVWSGLQTVAWNVAGTTSAPVNAARVNIRLSPDGGLTFPIMLVSNTPNDGAEGVVLPNTFNTNARVMVEATSNIFFDISDGNFTINFSTPQPRVVAEGLIVNAEGCAPANGAADPDETVVVDVALRNVGTQNTSNLVATLLADAHILSPSGPQSYGVLVAGGASVSRPFTLTASGSCGTSLLARLQLEDGSTSLGTVTNAFPLGAQSNRLDTVSNTNLVKIPSSGNSGNGLPYPSTLSVTGLTGAISKITVTLKGLTHTYPDDIDVLLVGPGGQSAMLLSDVGGGANVSAVNLTFDDTATNFLPDATAISAGTYKPTDFESDGSLSAPAPAGPYGAALSVFNGSNPNGTWSLYTRDDATPDKGTLNGGWSLTVVTYTLSCCAPVLSADVALSKTDSPDPVTAGSALTYTLWVTNFGPSSAGGVTVTDSLPAAVAFVSAIPSQGTCTNLGTNIVCSLGTLTPGGTAVVQLVVTPQSAGLITNRATVSSATADTNSANNAASAATAVLAPAQLSVSPASLAFGPVRVGDSDSDVFSIANAGGVLLTGLAAAGGPFAVIEGSPFSLAPGATAEVRIAFSPLTGGSFSNNIQFDSNGGHATLAMTGEGVVDPLAAFTGQPTSGTAPLAVAFSDSSSGTLISRHWNFGDGEVTNTLLTNLLHTYTSTGRFTVSLVVVGPLSSSTNVRPDYLLVTNSPAADLRIVLADTPDPVVSSNVLLYALTVTNAGPDGASGVIVTGALPAGVDFDAAGSSPECAATGSAVSCSVGDVATGSSTTLLIQVLVQPATAGLLTNVATASSATEDPDLTNNIAQAITAVADFDGDGSPDFSDADDDGDGMPDAYELLYGLSITNATDAGLDEDVDGFNNREEYIADTDPTNSNAFHRIIGLQTEPSVVIQFPSSTGRLYFLEYSTDLPPGDWLGLGSNMPGNGGTLSMTNTDSGALRHYRIGVGLP